MLEYAEKTVIVFWGFFSTVMVNICCDMVGESLLFFFTQRI